MPPARGPPALGVSTLGGVDVALEGPSLFVVLAATAAGRVGMPPGAAGVADGAGTQPAIVNRTAISPEKTARYLMQPFSFLTSEKE